MTATAILTDAALYEAITEKKAWALSALYDRYATVLYSLALKILSREKAAQEVVAETFVTVWRKSTTGGNKVREHVGTWLILLCRTLAISSYRAQRHLATSAIAVEQLAEWASKFAANDADDLLQAQEGRLLRGAFDQLSMQQRSTMEMVFFKGLTPDEIALLQKLRPEEVRAQIHQALAHMREHLAHAPGAFDFSHSS
ncbi:MAG: sigma-70 family RNA polymerase sigma factor [candidate division KSB1 bacterium]